MNPEQLPPAPLPNAPLPRLGDAPTTTANPQAAPAKRGDEIGQHLKNAFIYLGILLVICAVSSLAGTDVSAFVLAAYWGALGTHALVAIYLAGKSALSGDWSAFGRHVVAVLLVAAVAAGACWANVMILSAGGGLSGF